MGGVLGPYMLPQDMQLPRPAFAFEPQLLEAGPEPSPRDACTEAGPQLPAGSLRLVHHLAHHASGTVFGLPSRSPSPSPSRSPSHAASCIVAADGAGPLRIEMGRDGEALSWRPDTPPLRLQAAGYTPSPATPLARPHP